MTLIQAAPSVVGLDDNPAEPNRPLLARVADSIFWCSRYVERAEHLARALLVISQVSNDVGDLDPSLRDRQWATLLEALDLKVPATGGSRGEGIVRTLGCDPEHPGSIIANVARARENARGVRGEISVEMWETLNEMHWSLFGDGRGEGATAMLQQAADDLLLHVVRGSLLFQGVTDETLSHGQRWDFAIVGRALERADATCRLVTSRVQFLDEAGPRLEAPLRNIHLMAMLRMCGGIESYRRRYLNTLGLRPVVTFLLLAERHPRSLRYSIKSAQEAVRRIAQASRGDPFAVRVPNTDAAERILGRLSARLEYADADDVLGDGGPLRFLRGIRRGVAEAQAALHARYFMA
jgi:uncharacterized alpha-E superfamily protein